MKKRSAEVLKSSQSIPPPPPPPAFPMLDKMVALLPIIQQQQKALIEFYKAETKSCEKFLGKTEQMMIKLPLPWPPSFVMMDKVIDMLPDMVKMHNEIIAFNQARSKNAIALTEKLELSGHGAIRKPTARKSAAGKKGK